MDTLRNFDDYDDEYDPEDSEEMLYKGTSFEIDIIILLLEKPLQYVFGKVESIPLPRSGTQFPTNLLCYVSGWGETNNPILGTEPK